MCIQFFPEKTKDKIISVVCLIQFTFNVCDCYYNRLFITDFKNFVSGNINIIIIIF